MKKDIHPKYEATTITCACGNKFETFSTKKDIHIEVCSSCHPFFTGKHKIMDTAGRVDKFKAKLSKVQNFKTKAKKTVKEPKKDNKKVISLKSLQVKTKPYSRKEKKETSKKPGKK